MTLVGGLVGRFDKNIEIAEPCKGVHRLDIGESFQMTRNEYLFSQFKFLLRYSRERAL